MHEKLYLIQSYIVPGLLYHCNHLLCLLPDALALQRGDESPLLQHRASLPSSSFHSTHPTAAHWEQKDKKEGGRIAVKERSVKEEMREILS